MWGGIGHPIRTLEERAKRLFNTKGVPSDQLDPALKVKAKQGKESVEKLEEIALLEAQVYAYIELLGVRLSHLVQSVRC